MINSFDKTASGDTSPPDKPNLHPGPDKGIIVFKNLTGGALEKTASFAVTGREHANVNTTVTLSSGQEKSVVLFPGHYDISISFDGMEKPITGTKALLQGRVEYVYFYVGKDGKYKGGINTDSAFVYGDISYNYYQDNENSEDNKDGNHIPNPGEGDVSGDNDPRTGLPLAMRENYGVVIIHNLSKSMPLLKLVFDHYTNDDVTGNNFDLHYEMNPGPDKGNSKSIVLRPGVWKVRSVWIDPADPRNTGGVIDTRIIKTGISNYLNHLYFYKAAAPDNKYYLTDKPDNTAWTPQPDSGDYLNNNNTGGVDLKNEGQITNENEDINTGGSQWDSLRNNYGVVKVQNLSARVRITKVTFTHNTDHSRKWEMGSVGIQSSRSIILENGTWDVVIDYIWGSQPGSKTLNALDVKPVGLTNIRTLVYFYYFDDGDNSWEINDDYRVEGGIDAPPVYQNDGGSVVSGGGSGGNEGDSPGSLTDANKGSLGLVVVKNLSKNADISAVSFSMAAPSKSYSIISVSRANQMSILLGAGDWTHYLEYDSDKTGHGRIPAGNSTGSITVTAGSIYTLYFYQDNTGGYSIIDNWPPVYPAAPPLTDGNSSPASDNEGFLHIKNASSSTILTKLSYRYNGADTEMNLPGNVQLVPGAESANDAILPVGAVTVRFFNGVKQRWSGAIPISIKARQTFTVTYIDGMDISDLPDGYGMVRVTNKSSEAVQSVVFYDTQMNARPELFTLVSGDTDSVRVPIGAYVTRFKMESFTSEFIVTIDNKSNRIVAVTITDQSVTDKSNVSNPDKTVGGIRIFNEYPMNAGSAAYLDTKIFKYNLYKVDIEPGTGKHTNGNNPDYLFDGTKPYKPVMRGQNENISTIVPGLYKLEIIAGSYPWTSYKEGIVINGIALNENLITYDCGEMLIVAGEERQYRFNNYHNEKDTPKGYVTFYLSMSDNDNTMSIVHFEIAVMSKAKLTAAEIETIYNKPWTASTPIDAVREFAKWPGAWVGAIQGPYAPKDTLAFEWGGILNSFTNHAGPFAIPPGIYWTRYNDNWGSGVAHGGNEGYWRLVDLRGYAGQQVNCASDHSVGNNWAPVPQK
ncbi:MAG: hypothetical protein LBI94_01300 [Treponema sp.]|nr:hypothetical protein [Treponema sp.]